VNKLKARITVGVVATLVATAVSAPTASAYDVVCKDGTISHAGGKQGACSWHGGVAGGSTTTTSLPTITSPDTSAPMIIVMSSAWFAPTSVGVGGTTPAVEVSVSDDRGFPTSSQVTVDWADGSKSSAPFTPGPSGYVPANVSVAGHVYRSPGRYAPVISLVDAAGNAATTPLADVTVVAAPQALGPPVVRGIRRAGRTVTCSPGSWAGAPALRVFWLAKGHRIPGATGRTFAVRTKDAGRQIACQVVAKNAGGTTQVTSAGVLIHRAQA
jgi:hypothetical protein